MNKTRLGLLALWAAWLYTALYIDPVNPAWLDRYSSRHFAALVIYTLFSAVVTLALIPSVSSRLPIRRWLANLYAASRARLLVIGMVVVGTATWTLLPVRPPALVYPTVVLMLLLWLIVESRPPDWSIVSAAWSIRWLIVFAVAAIGIQFVVLLHLPLVHTHDEGAYSHIAIRYLQTGGLPADLYAYPPRHFVGWGSWLVTLAHWFQIFGFGWWAGRLYVYIASLLALVFIYLAGAQLYNKRVGLVTAAVMALTDTFVSLHQIRPDAPMVMMVCAGLWAYARAWKRPTPFNYGLLGLIVTFGFEVHLLNIAFWGAYAVVLGLDWLHTCWRTRRLSLNTPLLWFLLGSIPPLLLFFVTHLLPEIDQPRVLIVSQQSAGLIRFLKRETQRWIDYAITYPLEALIAVMGLALVIRDAFKRRHREAQLVLRWGALVVIAYIVVAPTGYATYTRYFLPIIALFIGPKLIGKQALNPVFAVVIGALLFGNFIGQVGIMLPDVAAQGVLERSRPPIVDYVEANIPAGDTVVMNAYYYLYLDDPFRYTYISPGLHPPTIERLGGPPQDEVWASLNADIIVLDVGKDERTIWLDDYLDEAGFVALDLFESQYITIYVPPDSPLAESAD